MPDVEGVFNRMLFSGHCGDVFTVGYAGPLLSYFSMGFSEEPAIKVVPWAE